MTLNSRGYSLPEQMPDGLALRRGEMGGWVLEANFGGQVRTAGFGTEQQAVQVIAAMLMGKQVVAKVEKPVITAPTERRKPGPKKGWKQAASKANGETSSVESKKLPKAT